MLMKSPPNDSGNNEYAHSDDGVKCATLHKPSIRLVPGNKELESCGLIEATRRGKFIDVTFCRPAWEVYLAELKKI